VDRATVRRIVGLLAALGYSLSDFVSGRVVVRALVESSRHAEEKNAQPRPEGLGRHLYR